MNSLKEDKELFNFLSNKDLSWNKNEGVKFVTAAIDKSFRIACLGIGYGGTFAVNRFRRFGTKFNGRLKNEKMRQSHEDWLAKRGAERLAARGTHGADTAAAPVGGALDLRSSSSRLPSPAAFLRPRFFRPFPRPGALSLWDQKGGPGVI